MDHVIAEVTIGDETMEVRISATQLTLHGDHAFDIVNSFRKLAEAGGTEVLEPPHPEYDGIVFHIKRQVFEENGWLLEEDKRKE